MGALHVAERCEFIDSKRVGGGLRNGPGDRGPKMRDTRAAVIRNLIALSETANDGGSNQSIPAGARELKCAEMTQHSCMIGTNFRRCGHVRRTFATPLLPAIANAKWLREPAHYAPSHLLPQYRCIKLLKSLVGTTLIGRCNGA